MGAVAMRKSQIEAMALTAMRDAVAVGKSEHEIIHSAAVVFYKNDRRIGYVYKAEPRARAIYDKHFTVKEPN